MSVLCGLIHALQTYSSWNIASYRNMKIELFTIRQQLCHTVMIYFPKFQLDCHFCDKMMVGILFIFCDKVMVGILFTFCDKVMVGILFTFCDKALVLVCKQSSACALWTSLEQVFFPFPLMNNLYKNQFVIFLCKLYVLRLFFFSDELFYYSNCV